MAIRSESDLSSYKVDDVPLSPTMVVYSDEMGNTVHPDDFDTVQLTLVAPDGTLTILDTDPQHQHVHITWGAESLLTEAGIYKIVTVFALDEGAHVTTDPVEFITETTTGWHTLESARRIWPDAPTADVMLYEILDAARTQCVEYAPALALGAAIPETYRQAQLSQARALFMAVITSQNETVGIDGYQIRVFPLDWNVRALLRPKRAVGVIA